MRSSGARLNSFFSETRTKNLEWGAGDTRSTVQQRVAVYVTTSNFGDDTEQCLIVWVFFGTLSNAGRTQKRWTFTERKVAGIWLFL